jgi:hypothetical protein
MNLGEEVIIATNYFKKANNLKFNAFINLPVF